MRELEKFLGGGERERERGRFPDAASPAACLVSVSCGLEVEVVKGRPKLCSFSLRQNQHQSVRYTPHFDSFCC